MAEPEPDLKKRQLENDPIFDEFIENTKEMEQLGKACDIIYRGYNDMSIRLLEVIDTNARSCVSFTHATCDVTSHMGEENSPVVHSVGTIFTDGIETLRMYLMDDEDVYRLPKESKPRTALAKLLKFILYDKGSFQTLKQGQKECELAVQVAHHLLSKLSLKNKFTLEHRYAKKTVKSADGTLVCPCGKSERVEEGEFGDTSFGYPGGWHGCVDILLENISIKMKERSSEDESSLESSDVSSDDSSQSSVEIKKGVKFSTGDESQLLSQCIVFSFLQNQSRKARNFLIPSLAISPNTIIVTFYDSENDILLQTKDLPLMDTHLDMTTVVFLWLTLNYRYFCSGISDTMKAYKSNFFERVGDVLPRYKLETTRPVQRTSNSKEGNKYWTRQLGILIVGKQSEIPFSDVKRKKTTQVHLP